MAAPSKSVLKSSEDIFAKMMAGDSPAPRKQTLAPREPTQTATSLDIRNVKVSDSFVGSIIESAFSVPKIEKEEPEEEQINESEVKEKLSDLVKRLAALVSEAKTVIQEMTTCGMIGTNQKFLLLDKKKKNGPSKTNKRK